MSAERVLNAGLQVLCAEGGAEKTQKRQAELLHSSQGTPHHLNTANTNTMSCALEFYLFCLVCLRDVGLSESLLTFLERLWFWLPGCTCIINWSLGTGAE